ncbi:MAG: hypothetical protein A4S12_02235 [Proteobacteria bacterium SG_bin5]|nr:hypothetical protein [Sphingomonas sp.]OQW39390.1 MAG: hypothetical protein A4S12_02235 [Proteobacteria bacterium SG_bin5]
MARWIVAAAAAMTAATSAERPIRLERAAHPGGIELRVVAAPARPGRADYRLTVETGSGNRSTQSGTITLVPGDRTTVVTLRVSVAQPWRAVLTVTLDDGAVYQTQESGTP